MVAQINFYCNMSNLTKKQKQVFDFINIYIEENGISPTIEEIRKKMKLKAVSTIHEHINSLKDKGYLSKSENSARSIVVLKRPKTIKDIMRRQDEIVAMFTEDQQNLINEAINIEYKLAMIEQGYKLENLDR
jgi:SOS-response transcriptional repressor LexA